MFHHHFSSEKVRMSEEARSVAGKYVEVFVREAIARAAFERQEGVKLKEREGRRTVVGEGDFLEASLAPNASNSRGFTSPLLEIKIACG